MENIKIYGYRDIVQEAYFDTLEELQIYLNSIDKFGGTTYTIEYLGDYKGRKDVIKTTTEKGDINIESAIDEDGYAIYNERKGTWEFNYGSLKEKYEALKERGIVLSEDIYKKIDEFYKHLIIGSK